MADFNFYLNRQGIQGRKGDKGDAGFTPTISVSEQTLNSYKLKITNEYNEFETPNLIGNLGVTDNGGTYLRYNPATGAVSTGEIDGATTEVVGGVRKSTDADLTNLSADTVVTPANVADMLPLLLEAGTDNVTITQDEVTSKTKISVEGGSGSGDVTAAGNNRFTGDNTFTGKVNIAGGALTVDGVANLNQTTAQYLNAVNITSTGEVNAVSIKANDLRSDDIHTTENKKYLTELDVDNQTIQVVNGKLHCNLDELGNEVNSLTGDVNNLTGNVNSLTGEVTDLTGRVTANEADISAMKTGKQNKLTAGANVTLTDLTDGTVRIDATGGGGTGDIPIATTTTAGKVKPDGTTITITDDGTISAVGGGGGGATIDDSTTATTSVWSSSKTNTEISTVANEVAQVQGNVASLDGDVSTLKTNVSGLKTDVSGLKTDVSGLKTDVSGLKTSKQNTLVSGTNIKTINGETILGEGNITVGGSTPANMVTTDTAQDITANKTFYGEIRVGADNNYATLAKFSKEALASGDSTLLEHIDLGEASFVVQGSLGKKVYETDKYVYKKYINVDDLSDNQIAIDNSISSQVAHMAMPSDKYIDLTLGASETTYTAPADGWFIFRAQSTGVANTYIDTSVFYRNQIISTATYIVSFAGDTCGFVQQAPKGAILSFVYNATFGTISAFRFVYAKGSEPTV